MAFIGVQVTTTEVPTAQVPTFNTANAFVVGVGPALPPSGSPALIGTIPDIANTIGARGTANNYVLYDSLECFLRESAGTNALAYVSTVQGTPSLDSVTTALNAFSLDYGPGQVITPGISDWTSPAVDGLTLLLGDHCNTYNRVAIVDMPDNTAAATLESDVGTTFNAEGVGPVQFWAGNLNIPGFVPATTRSVPPSAAMAAMNARVDASGNPNRAPAGINYTFRFANGNTSTVSGRASIYNNNDLFSLNDYGINTFAVRSGNFVPYGMVSTLKPTTDAIFWEFPHMRMRMALVAQANLIAERFVFSQIDGQNSTIGAFETALAGMLATYYNVGALYGKTMDAAFNIDTASVNTPATLQAGQLNALINVRLSADSQMVSIVINSVPITMALPPVAG